MDDWKRWEAGGKKIQPEKRSCLRETKSILLEMVSSGGTGEVRFREERSRPRSKAWGAELEGGDCQKLMKSVDNKN